MPIGGQIEFLRVRPAIHIDNPKRVGTAYIEDIDALEVGHMQELYAIRSLKLTSQARRMTSSVRFEFVDLPIVVKRFGPWLKWNRLNGCQSRTAAEVVTIER